MDLRKYRRLVREVIDNICAVMTVQACSSLSLFLSLSTSRILRLVVVLCKPAFVLLARLAYEYGRERCSPPYLMALASLPSVILVRRPSSVVILLLSPIFGQVEALLFEASYAFIVNKNVSLRSQTATLLRELNADPSYHRYLLLCKLYVSLCQARPAAHVCPDLRT